MKMLKTLNCTVRRGNIVEDKQNLIPRLKEAIKEKNDLIALLEKSDGIFNKLVELETSNLETIDNINKRYFFSLSGVTNDCTAQTCCC